MRQQSYLGTVMRLGLPPIAALVASATIAAALFVQSLSSIGVQAQTRQRYLPENAASDDLIFPKIFHEWVLLRSRGSWTLPIPKQQAPAL